MTEGRRLFFSTVCFSDFLEIANINTYNIKKHQWSFYGIYFIFVTDKNRKTNAIQKDNVEQRKFLKI